MLIPQVTRELLGNAAVTIMSDKEKLFNFAPGLCGDERETSRPVTVKGHIDGFISFKMIVHNVPEVSSLVGCNTKPFRHVVHVEIQKVVD